MKRSNISKNEILKIIKINLGIPISFSEKILNELLDIIIEGLNTENEVKVNGFGTFKILDKKSRLGRNPKTGKIYEIKARKTVAFYPSKKIKYIINE
tara:strand:- start:1067 stop:1357 length:291 start_codon:yes stop_codon:yes gene_type:complete